MSDDEPKTGSGFTLDGRPAEDTPLPSHWGRSERREGRIGEWGDSSPSRNRSPKRDGAESYIGGEKR